MTTTQPHAVWAQRIEAELRGNILPFWMAHTVDRKNGGFYGALSNELHIDNDVERSAVLCARILWTFSVAYRRYGDHAYLKMARHAYAYLTGPFLDRKYGGIYWSVDRHGAPLLDRKHTYAQAFAIYALAEYHQSTADPGALPLARDLFHLIETYSYDPANLGNVECLSREWGALDDMRLSAVDINSRKSMNTMLHIMEGYSNLLRVWDDALVRQKLRWVIKIFLDHIIDPATHHLRLFFDDTWNWRHLTERASYGHDIEAGWLLVDAAEALGDDLLVTRARAESVAMAETVYAEALEPDGSLLYESQIPGENNERATQKHWWPHAEAVVGFYNAYQISGQARFAEAARRCWDYIEAKFVDRAYGDWFKVLDRAGIPLAQQRKVGPWECPYHQSRVGFEMLRRLNP